MSASTPLLVRSFRVGQFTCTLSAARSPTGAPACAVAEWSPHLPDRLSQTELAQYRVGRDKAAAEIAAALGGAALVVET